MLITTYYLKNQLLSILLLKSSIGVQSIELQLDSLDSLQNATSTIVAGVFDYYTGDKYGQPIGLFGQPYYWWESGLAWGSLLDYSFYTNDHQYDQVISQALLAQIGENWDYVPLNQSTTEGNDDQAFWGIATMAAVEKNFTNPPPNQAQWLYLTQAVFNTMSSRWDLNHCDGGLRWQIFEWNVGYDYKNTVSNGGLFHLSARLARYTQNQTYLEWAEKTWDWMEKVKVINSDNENYYTIYDGVKNCTNVTELQWTYNAGLLLSGTAYLYNYTNSSTWEDRFFKLLQGVSVFFETGIAFEPACQPAFSCNNDQRAFKAFFARSLGLSAQLVEGSRDIIDWYLTESALAAAQSCVGGYDGVTCGLNWQIGGWDGFYGLGEQLSALEMIQNTRYRDIDPPYTAEGNGSSQGNPAAGVINLPEDEEPNPNHEVSSADKAGAAIITTIAGGSIVFGAVFLVI